METKTEINLKIIEVTNQIRENCPELLKYLNEMVVTIPNKKSPEVSIKALNDYYDSLLVMLNDYLKEHSMTLKNKP